MELILESAGRAGIRVRRVSGVLLIAAVDAGSFLDACLEQGVQVLGIEGFYWRGEKMVPEMDAIADFSGLDDFAQSAIEGKRFLETVGSADLLFDFVLERVGQEE